MPTLSVIVSIRLGNSLSDAGHAGLLPVALLWALTLVVPGALSPVISTLQSVLNSQATFLTQRKVMEAACRIEDLKLIESPEIHDDLEVLSRDAPYRALNLLVTLVEIFRSSLTLISLSVVLATLAWWLPLAFLLPLIPVTVAVTRSQMEIYKSLVGKGMSARLIKYFLSVLLDVKLAKEIRTFNLSGFFMDKHRQAFSEMESELNQTRKKQLWRPQPWNLLYLMSALGVMYWFVGYLSSGKISFGALLGIIQSVSFFAMACQGMVYSFANVSLCLSFFARLKKLESIAVKNQPALTHNNLFPLQEIVFENVCFSWPNGTRALNNISFTLRAGEHLAIIGENGAGKTTLIKLLCRLYQPDSGKITCNGIDIARIDSASWSRQLSAVFQDFGHYNLSTLENVTFSSQPDRAAFLAACRKAQFTSGAELADSLLGKEYGGADLSGGQWQRLALARALYASGELIILDEPTSAMDPRVEIEILNQFADMVQGKTAVIVTHRLGAVKNASKLLVLKKGEIAETGTPAELEQARGEYYELLNLQRAQYAKEKAAQD
ncbi:ABC transporter ATP-binding protein [Kalamiella sp. sgz302252]|uniref:ABC transporter ATP-binding protein n=1 Tax=Pantoea sp. sgz302252 TaxID=3341827 RepID=UPI0036D3301E